MSPVRVVWTSSVPPLAYISLAQLANEYIVFDMLVQVFLLPSPLCPVSIPGRSRLPQPSIVTSMCSNTDRAQPELPPELIDRIIDFLHDVPKALIACSLVARSWTATSRYHRFSEAVLLTTACWAKFDRLIEISPTMIQYIRSIVIDVGCADSTRWISACASFTSLQHIRMAGAITPPWGSEAAAISSVAHKITSLTLNLAVVRRGDIWQIIRMFPNLVSLHYIGAVCVPALEPLLPTLPCYSPPILTISVATTSLGGILDDLSDPPYPLISLLTFDIHDTDPKQGYGLHSLAKAYAGQISRLRLHNRGLPRRCTSLHCFQPQPFC